MTLRSVMRVSIIHRLDYLLTICMRWLLSQSACTCLMISPSSLSLNSSTLRSLYRESSKGSSLFLKRVAAD